MSTETKKRGCPFELLLFLLVPALIIGGILLAVRAVKEGPTDEVDQGVVATYIGLITAGRYDEAYYQCLTAQYRKRMTGEEFAQAHRDTRGERGSLSNREILLIKQGRNLFSGVQNVELLYRLDYERGEWRNYLMADTADGEWRINGTYRRTAKHLEMDVW